MFLLDGCLLSLSINFMNLLVRVNCLHLWHVLATLYIILTEPCNYIHQKHSFFFNRKMALFLLYLHDASNAVTGKGMRHSPIKNGNVTSFFAMDAPRSLSDFYHHFQYEIGEYEIGEYE